MPLFNEAHSFHKCCSRYRDLVVNKTHEAPAHVAFSFHDNLSSRMSGRVQVDCVVWGVERQVEVRLAPSCGCGHRKTKLQTPVNHRPVKMEPGNKT